MSQINFNLLNILENDEKKVSSLYKAGSYWKSKAIKIHRQLRRNGLKDFRGYDSGVGTSFCDNVIVDCLNEEVSKFNDIFKFFAYKVPVFKRVGKIINKNIFLSCQIHQEKLSALQFF